MNFTKIIAAVGLLSCIFLAIRMALSPRLRQQLDARLRRAAWAIRDLGHSLLQWLRGQRFKKAAASEAEAAIRRARTKPEGEWDGNVYRPKSFDKSSNGGGKKPRNLH